MVSYRSQPAVMLAITKKQDANIIKLVDRIKEYVEDANQFAGQSGIQLDLVDDQTQITKDALRVMQNNAALGLGLVLLVTWLFVGLKISFLTCIGIPFILAGTFWVLSALGQTLNVSHATLQAIVDRLHHHDRVIYQHTKANHHTQKHTNVQCLAEC